MQNQASIAERTIFKNCVLSMLGVLITVTAASIVLLSRITRLPLLQLATPDGLSGVKCTE